MKTERLATWQEFKNRISEFFVKPATIDERSIGYFSTPLFRGHTNADWKLATTLEREKAGEHSVLGYSRMCNSARRYLSNHIPKQIPYDEKLEYTYDSLLHHGVPNQEYWAFLRHHGFPSPLLDWTESPYVAAHFAFSAATTNAEIAVFVYREYCGGGKASSSSAPAICTIGPWSGVHKRHALQQSWYSYCIIGRGDAVYFCPHEGAFNGQFTSDVKQDDLIKLILPTTERATALKDLFRMNITPYSLMHTDDSIVSTAAMRIFGDY